MVQSKLVSFSEKFLGTVTTDSAVFTQLAASLANSVNNVVVRTLGEGFKLI